jgi:hypothetical protein
MVFLKSVCFALLVAMVLVGVALPEDAEKVRIIDGLGKSVFAIFGLLLLGYIWQLQSWWRQPKSIQPTVEITGRAVIVDGSNVMHWGGEPSIKVLTRVLKELQNRGLQPVVYFDANVGYKLFDKQIKPAALAAQLGLPIGQVVFAPSRTPADEILLERAISDGLRVVTNDRFLDWKQRFPKVGEKGFLIKGLWKEGSVILLGLGRTNQA